MVDTAAVDLRKRDHLGRIALAMLALWLCEYAYSAWVYAHDANILAMSVPEAALFLQALAALVLLPIASPALAILGRKMSKGTSRSAVIALYAWGAIGAFLIVYMLSQV